MNKKLRLTFDHPRSTFSLKAHFHASHEISSFFIHLSFSTSNSFFAHRRGDALTDFLYVLLVIQVLYPLVIRTRVRRMKIAGIDVGCKKGWSLRRQFFFTPFFLQLALFNAPFLFHAFCTLAGVIWFFSFSFRAAWTKWNWRGCRCKIQIKLGTKWQWIII